MAKDNLVCSGLYTGGVVHTGASESTAVLTETLKELWIGRDEYVMGEGESQSILYMPGIWLRQPQWAVSR